MSRTFLEALTSVGKNLQSGVDQLKKTKVNVPVTTELGTSKVLTSLVGTQKFESVSNTDFTAKLYKNNLFIPKDIKQTRGSGITYSINNGVISVKGTATEWKTIDTGIKWETWMIGKTVEIVLFDIYGTFPASSVMYVAHRFSGTVSGGTTNIASSINSSNKDGIRFTCTAVADSNVMVAIYSGAVLDNKFGIVVRVVDQESGAYPTEFKQGEVYNITEKEVIDLGSVTDYAYLYSTSDMKCTETQRADVVINNTVDWVNAKRYGCAGDGKTDDSDIINKIMKQLADNGGGVVYFPKGTYMVSATIEPPENVSLKGCGYLSKIKLLEGSECDLINVVKTGVSVTHLCLEGDYNGTTGNGLVIGTGTSVLSLGQNIYEDIMLQYFPENGLVVNAQTWVMFFNNIRALYCKNYGICNFSTDNNYNNIYTYRCGLAGLYNKGANTRYSNAKLIYTGYGIDTSVGVTGSYGLYCTNCERVQFTNIEIQDGIYNGAKLNYCADLQINNLLLDYNTSIQQSNSEEILATELTVESCSRVQGNVIFACYNSNKYTTSQLMTVSASLKCTLEVNLPTNTRMTICSNNAIMCPDDKIALMKLLN